MNRPKTNSQHFGVRSIIIISLAISALSILLWGAGDGGAGSGTFLANSVLAQSHKTAGEAEGEHEGAGENVEDIKTETYIRSVFATDPLESLAAELQARKKELDRREKELNEREENLRALDREVKAKLAKVEAAYSAMQRFSDAAQEQRQAEIGKWVKIYEAMKAPEAAKVFETLDQDLALQILVKMDSKKAGKLIEEMVKDSGDGATDSKSREKARDLANALAELRP